MITKTSEMDSFRHAFRTLKQARLDPQLRALDVPEVITYEPRISEAFEEDDLRRVPVERGWSKISAVRNVKCHLTGAAKPHSRFWAVLLLSGLNGFALWCPGLSVATRFLS